VEQGSGRFGDAGIILRLIEGSGVGNLVVIEISSLDYGLI